MPPETPLHDAAAPHAPSDAPVDGPVAAPVLDLLAARPAVLPGTPRRRRLARLQAADARRSAAVHAVVLGRRRVTLDGADVPPVGFEPTLSVV